MIFVTVGTHEQQFDRLIKAVDELKRDGVITEEVFMQTGFSSYEPKCCKWKKLIPYSEMIDRVRKARIIITHGGPASFIMPLQEQKIPIVVPRQEKYHEHVNDHQVEFTRFIAERQGNIIPVYEIAELKDALIGYEEKVNSLSKEISSNNENFNIALLQLINQYGGGPER